MINDIKDRSPNKDTIAQLESMLADARSGELRTIIALTGWDDDSWTHTWSMDYRNTRLRMIGALTMLGHEISTNQSLSDGDSVLSMALDN